MVWSYHPIPISIATIIMCPLATIREIVYIHHKILALRASDAHLRSHRVALHITVLQHRHFPLN